MDDDDWMIHNWTIGCEAKNRANVEKRRPTINAIVTGLRSLSALREIYNNPQEGFKGFIASESNRLHHRSACGKFNLGSINIQLGALLRRLRRGKFKFSFSYESLELENDF